MSSRPRIVLAGGGPAAIEAALALRELVGDRVGIELIAPDRDLVVRAYEVLTPFHEGREHCYPLAQVAADLDLELIRDSVGRVDAPERTAVLRSGTRRPYDSLVLAVGARYIETVRGAIPFRGARDAGRLRELLLRSHSGRHQSVAFVVPTGRTWALPIYELALHTAAWLAERGVGMVPLTIVSPERSPLAAFGRRASAEVADVLRSHGVEFVTGHAVRIESGQLLMAGGQELAVDLAVALTRLGGPEIRGVPSDHEGFVPVDEIGRVLGVERVFAAGDATSFPLKQGGLATQQADAIAECLAAELGAEIEPAGFQPVLRAILYGGRDTRYLQAEVGARLEQSSEASATPLWAGSSKLVGRYVGPYLDSLDRRGLVVGPRPA